MPYLKIVPRSKNHDCPLPVSPKKRPGSIGYSGGGYSARSAGPGSVWKCSQCGQHWVVVENPTLQGAGQWKRISLHEAQELVGHS